VGGGGGAHWVLSTPKALTLESPLLYPKPTPHRKHSAFLHFQKNFT